MYCGANTLDGCETICIGKNEREVIMDNCRYEKCVTSSLRLSVAGIRPVPKHQPVLVPASSHRTAWHFDALLIAFAEITPLDGKTAYSAVANQNNYAITTYTYKPDNPSGKNGLIDTVTGASGEQTGYEYNAKGNVIQKKTKHNGNWNTIINTYNSKQRLETETLPDGTVITYHYDTANNLIQTDVAGNDGTSTTKMEYDQLGRKTKEIQPEQSEDNGTRYEYNIASLISKATGANGGETTYAYDLYGNIIKETYPNGSYLKHEYDRLDRKTSTYYYDSKTGGGARQTEKIQYGSENHNPTVTITRWLDDGVTNTTVQTLDFEGKLKSSKNADGLVVTREYTGEQLTRETDTAGREITYTYNGRGLPAKKTTLLGWIDATNTKQTAEEQYTYDSSGRLISQKTKKGNNAYRETRMEYDEAGNLVQTENKNEINNQNKTVYTTAEYDWAGRMTSQKKGLAAPNASEYSAYQYQYTYLGNVKSTTDPLNQTESMAYDAAGRLTELTDRNGWHHQAAYDNQGNPLAKNSTGSGKANINKTYTYDSMGNLQTAGDETYTYNGKGDRLTETKGDTEKTYTYNLAGKMTGYTIKENGTTLKTVTNTYDRMGRKTTVSEDGTLLVNYSYDKAGRLIKTVNANGTIETRQYSEGGLLLRIISKRGSRVIADNRYEYHVTGEQSKKLNELDHSKDEAYEYDDLGQLIKVTTGTGANTQTVSYTYDLQGNRLSKNDIIYTYNKLNQLITETKDGETATYSYDNNGNMLSKSGNEGFTQEFDLLNRMTKYQKGTTTSTYTYHQNNMRATKTVDGVRTRQIWVGSNIALDITAEATVSCIHGNRLIKSDYGWSVYDGHGSVVALTDDNGAVMKDYQYDAFGIELGEQDGEDRNPFRYNSEYTDYESGYVYMRARYYSAEVGRFISQDPIMDGYNWYGFANNNPIDFIDPTGLYQQATTEFWQSYSSNSAYEESKTKQAEHISPSSKPKSDSSKSNDSIGLVAVAGSVKIDLGKGWSYEIHKAREGVNKRHIHVFEKNKAYFSQNEDGSPHDDYKNKNGKPPKKVMKKINEKVYCGENTLDGCETICIGKKHACQILFGRGREIYQSRPDM